MDHRTQAFRAASHLPPVSVCLLLAGASLILLCSRAETSGDPKSGENSRPPVSVFFSGADTDTTGTTDTAGAEVPSSEETSERAALSQEELRIWTWLHQAETLRKAGRSPDALHALRRAEVLADEARVPADLRTAIQRGLAENLGAVGRHEDAVEVWWRLLSMSPQQDEIARGLASSLYASGRLEEARRVYREILHAEFEVPEHPHGDQSSRGDSASGNNSAR